MKKSIIYTLTFFTFTIFHMMNVNAQIQIGATGTYAIPMGAFGAAPTIENGSNSSGINNLVGTANSGTGGGLFAKYFINENMAIGVSFNYLSFTGQEIKMNLLNPFPFVTLPSITGSFTSMPIALTYDYYFGTDKIKPFVGIELGYITTNATHNFPGMYTSSGSDSSQTVKLSGFFVAPVVGCTYAVTDNIDILASLKYGIGMNKLDFDKVANSPNVGIPSTSYLGLNIGVAYNIK